MPDSGGEKVCPICDSPLQPGSKKCGFCGTDLTIFDIDLEMPKKQAKPSQPPVAVPPPKPAPSMDSRIEEIFSRPLTQPPAKVAPELEKKVAPQEKEPEPKVEAAPAAVAEPEAKPVLEPIRQAAPEAKPPPVEAHYFECPECGAQVPEDAKTCPKCGVMFADDAAEGFQCPACDTMVSIDATSCPGCGALFVEPGEEEAERADEGEAVEPKPQAGPSEPATEPTVSDQVSEVAEAAPAEEAPSKKKGLFGWLSREKKEAEAREEYRPEGAGLRRLADSSARAAEPQPSEEVKVRELRRPTQEPEVRAPTVEPRVERARPAPPTVKDKGKELVRMVTEMKQMLSVARDREIDIGDSKKLIDDAVAAGREKDLNTAISLVQRSRAVLMAKIDDDLTTSIRQLSDEARVAGELGGEVSRATTYIREAGRAKGSGDVEAAYVFADKAKKELQPITGRYNDTRKKIDSLKQLIADSEAFFVDTKEARNILVESNRAFEVRDFDKVDSLVKSARDSVYKAIPGRMNEEIRRARDQLAEARVRNVNITPMITVLKSAARMLKTGEYGQALKEMREFKEMMKKV